MSNSDWEIRLRSIPGVSSVTSRGDGLWVEGAALDVEAMAAAMNAWGVRLGTVTAVPLAEYGETQIIYHYIGSDSIINVKTATRNGRVSSIAASVRAASWAEREIKDLFAVDFPGHPDPRPLLRPASFEEGMFRAAMNRQARMTK